MSLLTEAQRFRLLQNGAGPDQDHAPAVRLLIPDARAQWLLSELDPEDPDRAFGLCDLGMGYPELGFVSLEEISTASRQLGLSLIADPVFVSLYPMSVYTRAARLGQEITVDPRLLRLCVSNPSHFLPGNRPPQP